MRTQCHRIWRCPWTSLPISLSKALLRHIYIMCPSCQKCLWPLPLLDLTMSKPKLLRAPILSHTSWKTFLKLHPQQTWLLRIWRCLTQPYPKVLCEDLRNKCGGQPWRETFPRLSYYSINYSFALLISRSKILKNIKQTRILIRKAVCKVRKSKF